MNIKQALRGLLYPSIPKTLSDRWRQLATGQQLLVREALVKHYFAQALNHFAPTVAEYLTTNEGLVDMHDHLTGRLDWDRERVIPWLNAARPLNGIRVLEIGCGTGAATVALAEQGAVVTAIDVNDGNLNAARERCALYGLTATFTCINAASLVSAPGAFDLILFFATLEHHTHEERLAAMRRTWAMLEPGGLWACVETPNRLWWFDDHTAMLPFYHWLPDDLAMAYAARSPRPFMRAYSEPKGAAEDFGTRVLDFARRGRGVSYHEFDLTLGNSKDLDVVSSLNTYRRSRSLALRAKWWVSESRRFETFLLKHGRPRHAGFFQPNLDLIIRK